MSEAKVCRCGWVDLTKPDYIEYHDKEWGVPVTDDKRQFEFLTLESAQAGLSWYTILKRREGYRRAFADFDVQKVAAFDEVKITELLNDTGIIRNKLKVYAAVNNAKRFIEVQQQFGTFNQYIWSFVGGKPKINVLKSKEDFVATSTESDALSKDLKKRGFKFVGSTIVYAHMQAAGLINDHMVDCFRRQEIIDRYQDFELPKP